MSLAALFGKLQEHEIELARLEQHEEVVKKHKNISLKAESNAVQQNDSTDEDEDITILLKKIEKFLRKDKEIKINKRKFHKNNDASTPKQNFTCFECGNEGHMKADCPILAKKNNHKGKKEFKPRRAYIAWEDNDISSSSESKNEESVNMTLMASHHSDDEENEVSDSEINDKRSHEELQNAFNELYEECINLSKTCAKQKKQIVSLERKVLMHK